ncbi:MAG: hypothetical protein FWF47_07250 [Clostridia bacterium]|nr:hypothetical protein [Clostridia bacterium]
MRQELRSAFGGVRFRIAFAAMLLCFLGFSLPTWITRVGQGDRLYMSAFDQSFATIFFGGAILLLPFIAILPHALSQVDEIRTGFMFMKALRTTSRKYAVIKLVAVALSSAAAIGGASLLHSVLWNIVAGVYDPIARPITEVVFTEGTVYHTLKDHPYAWTAYVHAAIGFALSGALWSVIGLATSVWIPDALLTVTVPVMLYFIWKNLCFFFLFRRIPFPSMSALYNDGQYWWMYWQALIVQAILFIAAAGVYYTGLKRRLRYA